jgi:hypothetical protein
LDSEQNTNFVNSMTPEEMEAQKNIQVTTTTASTESPVVEELEQPKMNIDHPDFMMPQRLEDETPWQYKVRRWIQKAYIKQKKAGQFMWIAKDVKQPVYDKEDIEMKGKPIGYQVSKGFSYDKAKVAKALEIYKKKKELESNTNTTLTAKITDNV